MSCGIYKFENKINGKIYIGQAIDLEERKKKHKKNINDLTHQEEFYKALREFGWDNFSYVILESFEQYDYELINNLENFYIKYYNSLFPNGYNMIPGGSNGAGLAKGKIVQQFSLDGQFIAEYPSAHEAARQTKINYSDISACCREDNNKQRAGIYQWKYKDSTKQITPILLQYGKDIKVYQFSIENILINEFNSLKEASEKTGIARSTICNCCNNKSKTAGGYKWSYSKDIPQELKESKGQKKQIAQYDLNNNLIKIYESITAANKETGISISNISEVCKGKRKTAGKFKWKYYLKGDF